MEKDTIYPDQRSSPGRQRCSATLPGPISKDPVQSKVWSNTDGIGVRSTYRGPRAGRQLPVLRTKYSYQVLCIRTPDGVSSKYSVLDACIRYGMLTIRTSYQYLYNPCRTKIFSLPAPHTAYYFLLLLLLITTTPAPPPPLPPRMYVLRSKPLVLLFSNLLLGFNIVVLVLLGASGTSFGPPSAIPGYSLLVTSRHLHSLAFR